MTVLALALLLTQTAEPATETAPSQAQTPPAAAEPAPQPPPPAPEPSPWNAGITAGLTWISGNVVSLTAVGGAQATRKTDRTIWTTKLAAGYGEKYSPEPHDVLLYMGAITSQFDYRFNPTLSAFVGAGLDFDHVKSIELRGYGELGAGFTWLDRKRLVKDKEQQWLFFKTDLSARLQPESRYQYYPVEAQIDDVLVFGPRFAALLHWMFSDLGYLHQELEVLPNVLGKARVLLNSASKLGYTLLGNVAATVTFTLKYDSEPAPGKQSTDTILAVGLEANF
jgi:hypothetical protein